MSTERSVGAQKLDFPSENSLGLETVKIRVLPDGRVSRGDAAKFLGRSPRTLAQWALRREGPLHHLVGGRAFYFIDDLRAYADGGGANVAA